VDEERDISSNAWADVFARPARETLVGDLDPDDGAAFEQVAQALENRTGWTATMVWLGLPWRWSIAYHRSGDEHPALAYQVPDPRGSRVCVPVPAFGEAAPDLSQLTKPVRTVLNRSAIIAGYIWAEWDSKDFDPVAVEALLAARSGG
jgi:hypothetical protein